MTWLTRQAHERPSAMVLFAFATLVLSFALSGIAITISFGNQGAQNRATCRQVNELRRELVVAFDNLGYEGSFQELAPRGSCGELP